MQWHKNPLERVQHPQQHKEILTRQRRCLNCLNPGHVVNACQNPKICRYCKQRYHQSICPTLSKSRIGEKLSSAPEDETSNTTTTNTVRNKRTVLLQTAKAVENEKRENFSKNSKHQFFFAFLDCFRAYQRHICVS